MARSDRILKNQKIAFVREATKRLKRLPSSSTEDMIVNDTPLRMEGV